MAGSDEAGRGAVPGIRLSNGMEIPMLGFGCWELSGDEAHASVMEALRTGYRLIDTAQYYRNEAEVFGALRDSGMPREEIFLISKLNPEHGTERSIRRALDESLEKLGGSIDLMLIHWPTGADALQWRILEEYQEAGCFKAIGVSNYRLDGLRHLTKGARIQPVLDQIEIHPYYCRRRDVRELKASGIAVQAWSPLGAGQLGVLRDPVIEEIARKHGKTPSQVVLRWEIQRGIITIPRSKNPAHIRENFEAAFFELDDEDMQAINSLDKDKALWRI